MKSCPFCGGEASLENLTVRSGYGEYESHEDYHQVICKSCGAGAKRFHQQCLAKFTLYTVSDFRNNPVLRAKVEDDYDAYIEQTKQLAVDAWEKRI